MQDSHTREPPPTNFCDVAQCDSEVRGAQRLSILTHMARLIAFVALLLAACDAFVPSSSKLVRSAVQPKQQARAAPANPAGTWKGLAGGRGPELPRRSLRAA